MEGKSLVVVEQPQNVQTASVLIIEQFLNDHYRLRRNVLSGKVEFKVKSLNTTEMLEIIRDEYPNVTVTTKAKVELGRALVRLEYERKDHSHVAYYKAVPLKAA